MNKRDLLLHLAAAAIFIAGQYLAAYLLGLI
jgi:hypothetical protein